MSGSESLDTDVVEEPQQSSRTGRALALLGDHWTLLILQRVFLGECRYQQIRESIRVSDSILANRLKTLTDGGLLNKVAYKDGRTRYEYQMSAAGKATWRIYVAAWAWECEWLDRRDDDPYPELIHSVCGKPAEPSLVCGKCDLPITPRDTSVTRSTTTLSYSGTMPRRHRQARTLAIQSHDDLSLRGETMELLGDRWNTALAAAAVIGYRRFSDFERFLDIPPTVLSARLSRFVELGIVWQQPLAGGNGRSDYRLTDKGIAFAGILLHIVRWADENIRSGEESSIEIVHDSCGRKLLPEFACRECGRHLRRSEVSFALKHPSASDREPLLDISNS